jgi:hypothetical protein
MKETSAARAWREHNGPDPDSYWNVFRGERHVYGPNDIFEWELGKMPEGHILIFKYFTWADAWDWVFDEIPSEGEAIRIARLQTTRARRAYRKSQKKHRGSADAEEVYKDIKRTL